jgi:hypothetical protein
MVIKVGQVLYTVYSLGDKSRLVTWVVVKKPYFKRDTTWIHLAEIDENKETLRIMALRHTGLVYGLGCNYKVFEDLGDAEERLELLLRGLV